MVKIIGAQLKQNYETDKLCQMLWISWFHLCIMQIIESLLLKMSIFGYFWSERLNTAYELV